MSPASSSAPSLPRTAPKRAATAPRARAELLPAAGLRARAELLPAAEPHAR